MPFQVVIITLSVCWDRRVAHAKAVSLYGRIKELETCVDGNTDVLRGIGGLEVEQNLHRCVPWQVARCD